MNKKDTKIIVYVLRNYEKSESYSKKRLGGTMEPIKTGPRPYVLSYALGRYSPSSQSQLSRGLKQSNLISFLFASFRNITQIAIRSMD